ncbi:MAG TPA: SRPBCC family protein [Thermohalobaculum sp.]|nr:SRPBCC family protein [Thermohalobaculum sp.]
MAYMTSTVTRKATFNAPLPEVWGLVGNFHGVHHWHPAVADSIRETAGGEEFRLLKLEGGGEILEHLVGKTTHSYTYAIIRSPLPLAHYEAKIEANTAGAGTEITWSSSFTATADGAEEIVAGIYEAGLGALAERFNG